MFYLEPLLRGFVLYQQGSEYQMDTRTLIGTASLRTIEGLPTGKGRLFTIDADPGRLYFIADGADPLTQSITLDVMGTPYEEDGWLLSSLPSITNFHPAVHYITGIVRFTANW